MYEKTDSPCVWHVYPIHDPREHVTDCGGDCWCTPRIEKPCSQCDGPDPDCWMCSGSGWVETDSIPLGDRAVVVHNLSSG
jgi:hypothetical protein